MRTLLVEDQDEYAHYLADGFRNQGFAVDIEENGEQALWKAKTVKYDLIILDLNLPQKDGRTILRELRQDKNETFCVFITAEKGLETRIQVLEDGADDYLVKPFSFRELLARSRTILKRGGKCALQSFKIGDLSLDPNRFKVFYLDQELKLRRKEYDLLYFFMKNAGRVVSRTLILEKIWDLNADPFTNTVDVHVQSLRKKIIEASRGVDYIRTVYGRGYGFLLPDIHNP